MFKFLLNLVYTNRLRFVRRDEAIVLVLTLLQNTDPQETSEYQRLQQAAVGLISDFLELENCGLVALKLTPNSRVKIQSLANWIDKNWSLRYNRLPKSPNLTLAPNDSHAVKVHVMADWVGFKEINPLLAEAQRRSTGGERTC